MLGRTRGELAALDVEWFKALDLVDLEPERVEQSIEDARTELDKAIAAWPGNH